MLYRNASPNKGKSLTSFKRSLVCIGITLVSFASGVGMRPAHACNQTQALTYFGGYVDTYDPPPTPNVFFVFWGYGTYGDQQNFNHRQQHLQAPDRPEPVVRDGGHQVLRRSVAVFGDRLEHVREQADRTTPGATFITDEGGLPAPNRQGQIILTDNDISNEADFIGNTFGLSYDDVVVIFPPQNAPPPINGFCGRHFVQRPRTRSPPGSPIRGRADAPSRAKSKRSCTRITRGGRESGLEPGR